MPRPVPLPPPGFDELSVEEKVDYVQSLWDRIAADQQEVPVPEWHRAVLRQRLQDRETHPGDALYGEEVRVELQRELQEQEPDP